MIISSDQKRKVEAMSYYTLLIRDDKTSPWRIEFGDYSKSVVQDERDDIHYNNGDKLTDMMIIETDNSGQRVIDAAVAKLNKKDNK